MTVTNHETKCWRYTNPEKPNADPVWIIEASTQFNRITIRRPDYKPVELTHIIEDHDAFGKFMATMLRAKRWLAERSFDVPDTFQEETE